MASCSRFCCISAWVNLKKRILCYVPYPCNTQLACAICSLPVHCDLGRYANEVARFVLNRTMTLVEPARYSE
jgi:hypothetical protein